MYFVLSFYRDDPLKPFIYKGFDGFLELFLEPDWFYPTKTAILEVIFQVINLCSTCYFGGMCSDEDTCDYYTPLGDGDVDDYIEQRRLEFHDDWTRYISECGT